MNHCMFSYPFVIDEPTLDICKELLNEYSFYMMKT